MATLAERAGVYFANALLPAPLPTPPKSKMLPLLPTPCVVVLPKSPPKPSRAGAAERWDARKNAIKSPAKPGRADSGERWDAHKKPATASPTSSGSGQRPPDGKNSSAERAPSCERWESNRKNGTCSSLSGSSSPGSRASSSSQRWDTNKRSISRASSAARWDAHKKPRPLQADVLVDDGESSTGSNNMELQMPQPPRALHAGLGGFIASPEPSMLPMPTFLLPVA